MKKFLFLAMAAAAMVSCSQNEEIENAAQKAEIKLGTVVSNTTRATVTDLAELKKEGVGFTVYAYNSGAKEFADAAAADMGAFIANGKKATFSSNAWNIDGAPYYWPLTDNIHFFAYGNPGTGALNYVDPTGSNKYPTLTYTVAGVDAQTDLVVASATDQTYTKAGTSGVTLQFAHVLTQINFKIKTDDDNTYKLKTLSISGVKSKGTYDFEKQTWGAQDVAATYEYAITEPDGKVVTKAGTDIASAWMLMPQDMPTAENIVAINVSYDIFNAEGSKIASASPIAIDLKDTQAWQSGKKVLYTLTLTNKAAKVSLSVPDITPWGNETNVEK